MDAREALAKIMIATGLFLAPFIVAGWFGSDWDRGWDHHWDHHTDHDWSFDLNFD